MDEEILEQEEIIEEVDLDEEEESVEELPEKILSPIELAFNNLTEGNTIYAVKEGSVISIAKSSYKEILTKYVHNNRKFIEAVIEASGGTITEDEICQKELENAESVTFPHQLVKAEPYKEEKSVSVCAFGEFFEALIEMFEGVEFEIISMQEFYSRIDQYIGG